jgi:polar amino acid transport system substrate-binding protein
MCVVLGLLALLAGCGSNSSSSSAGGAGGGGAATTAPSGGSSSSGGSGGSGASAAADPAVEKLVPATIKQKGTLTVAADATYAPDEYIAPDGHTVIGMDPDLVKALAAVMGLHANVVNATFDTIIPGLSSGKYDMGASSMTDNKTREKTVDFVTYFTAGESFYTKAQGGTSVATIADICGKTVAVEKGTTEESDANMQGTKCKAAGKPGVTVLVFPDQNGANLAVSSGRAQLGFADTPVAEYQVKLSNGQFKVVGQPYANLPYGFPFAKGSKLAPAVLAALKVLMKNGTYAQILKKWGLSAQAISNPQINGATA